MSISILGCNSINASLISTENVSTLLHQFFKSGQLELDKSHPFYPNRSDEKIMRTDVIASVISICELLNEQTQLESKENFSLYVASGVFIEKIENHTRHLTKVYEELTDDMPHEEMMRKIYRISPPLLALQTLTNSAMSFISQYTGIQGNNATFGTTSASGFHAVKAAFDSVLYDSKKSVVSCSNGAGAHSFLMNSAFRKDVEGWFESAAVGSLILDKTQSEKIDIVKIDCILQKTDISILTKKDLEVEWHELRKDKLADAVIHSGAFTLNEFERDQKFCSKNWPIVYSNFNEYGNCGSANATNSISKAIELLKKGCKKIDVVDRDIYGVESYLRLSI